MGTQTNMHGQRPSIPSSSSGYAIHTKRILVALFALAASLAMLLVMPSLWMVRHFLNVLKSFFIY